MNKTVKTIAWICLILGLLGVAVDIGLYVRARSFASQFAERIESGELPAQKGDFRRTEDGDKAGPQERGSNTRGSNTRPNVIGRRPGSGDRFGMGLPILFMATGPVLAVVGGVMLAVNREPKPKKEENETKKTTKKKA